MIDPDHPALTRMRRFCLSHPETSERLSHQTPTFFVKQKHAFLSVYDNHHDDGRLAFVCAAPLGASEAMVRSDPEVFFRPPYVGHLGWLGVRLDKKLPWPEIEELVAGAWAVVAARHGVGEGAATPGSKARSKRPPAKRARAPRK